MEDLILKIIDIEENAQKIVKDVKKADKDLDKSLAEEIQGLQQSISDKAIKKTKSLREIELNDTEAKCNEIFENSERQIAALKQKYSECKDEWIEKIVDNIISS